MTNRLSLLAGQAGLIGAVALLASLTGCVVEGAGRRAEYRERPAVRVQAAVVFQDDYDYYPAYETFYSRNRREYVYRDGNSWVRRSEPRGVSLDVLLAAPSVRLDFHDSPEQHHGTVVRSYPRDWKRPAQAHDRKENHRENKDDRRDERDDRRDDRKDGDKRG